MEGAETTEWHTTSGSRDERAMKPDNVRVSQIRLGWTSRNVGNICEDQAKILVEEYVQRCRGVHGKLREMSSLLRGSTFSPTINFKWMVDIVAMPTGTG